MKNKELQLIASKVYQQVRCFNDTVRRYLMDKALLDIRHGYGVVSVKDYLFEKSSLYTFFSEADVSVDLVYVSPTALKEAHVHKKSTTSIVLLDFDDGFEEPLTATMFDFEKREWVCIDVLWTKEPIFIAPNVPHGFSVDKGGALWFLSIQNPPIASDLEEDFFVV